MKAQLNDVSTTLSALHRKSTSPISRHRNISNGIHTTATVAVAAELAAAAAASNSSTPSTNEEMQIYFSKLKQLVPFMPKKRKLSKLEIIQHVIDYICELQTALENGSGSPNGHASLQTACELMSAAATSSATSPVLRQPLGVLNSSNGPSNTCAIQENSLRPPYLR
ncbi:hypothetical protein CHUAL_013631 [Chamberlinius hualienensis]